MKNSHLINLPRWLLYTILFGVVLDLFLSGVVLYQEQQLQNNTAAARCWDRTLDQAYHGAPRVILQREAAKCAKLIP